jgi:hypothetical protein
MEYLAQSLPGLENQSFLVVVLIAGLVVCGGAIAFLVGFIRQLLKEKDLGAQARTDDLRVMSDKYLELSEKTTESVRILNDVLNRLSDKRGQ